MNIPPIPFEPFPKIARMSRDVVVTEKIDGTNASVLVTSDHVFAGSRNKWITPEDDNFGFAAWVERHADELRLLGAGLHRGEWWGSGIQRGYGLPKGEKRWSLFNTVRWCLHDQEPMPLTAADPRIVKYQDRLPACCGLVPELYRGPFDTRIIEGVVGSLRLAGSYAAPGFEKPEGIVVFHTAANIAFKKTLEKDEAPKSTHPKP